MRMRKYDRKQFEEPKSRTAPAGYNMIKWVKENPLASFKKFLEVFPNASLSQFNYCVSLIN